jgi:hypothetical protein
MTKEHRLADSAGSDIVQGPAFVALEQFFESAIQLVAVLKVVQDSFVAGAAMVQFKLALATRYRDADGTSQCHG